MPFSSSLLLRFPFSSGLIFPGAAKPARDKGVGLPRARTQARRTLVARRAQAAEERCLSFRRTTCGERSSSWREVARSAHDQPSFETERQPIYLYDK